MLEDREHVHGIVYSSGAVTAATGADSTAIDAFEQTDGGFLVRRAVTPYVVRETVVLASQPYAKDTARRWAEA